MGYLKEEDLVDTVQSEGKFIDASELVDVSAKPKHDPTITDRIMAAPATAVLMGKEFLKGATLGLVDLPATNAEEYLSERGLELHPWAKAGGEMAGTLAPMGKAVQVTAPLVKAAYPAAKYGAAATAGLAGMLYKATEGAIKGEPVMDTLKGMGWEGLTWTAQTALLDKVFKWFRGSNKIPQATKKQVLEELKQVQEERLMPTVGEGPPKGYVRSNAPLKGGRVEGEPIERLAGRGDPEVLYPEGGPNITQRLRARPPVSNEPTMPLGEGPQTGIIRQNAPSKGIIEGKPIEPLAGRGEPEVLYPEGGPEIVQRLRVPETVPESPMPLLRRDEGFFRGQAGFISPRLMADIAGTGAGATYGAIEDKESPTRGAIAGGLTGLALMEGGRKAISSMRDKGFWDDFVRFWNPTATLPEGNKFLDIRNMSKGKIHQVEGIVGKLKDRLGKFDEQTRMDMFDFLDGKIQINQLPPDARVAATNLRTINNLIGKGLVKRGELSQETFNTNKDKYIRYLYAKHILDENGIGYGAGTRLDESYLKQRKDLPDSVRKALGQIRDVGIAEPVSVGKPLADMVKFDMMETIAKNPEWTWTPPKVQVGNKKFSIGNLQKELEAQRRVAEAMPNSPEVQARLSDLENAMNTAQQTTGQAPNNFVKLPDTKSWGPLAGQFVRKEIANDLKPAWEGLKGEGNVSRIVNGFVKAEEKAMSMFKAGKTAFNIPTMVRNGFSNIVQLNMSGISLGEMPGLIKKTAKHLIDKDMIYGQAKRHGLFKTNFAQAEIADILKKVNTLQEGDGLGKILDKIGDLSKYYGKIDDFYKLAKFSEQVSKGVDYKTAAREANKWVMDYSLVHPSIDVARRHLMPFVTYQYKMLPLVVESLRKNPFTIGKYLAIPAAMYELSRTNLKLDDKDWKKLKKELPLYIKNNGNYVLLPTKSPQGHAQWVNLEYFFPWQNVLAVKRDLQEGNVGEALGDLGFSNPILDAYAVGKTLKGDTPPKDPFTGRLIYNSLDSPAEKAIKTSEWLYNKWMPTMLTRFGALGTTMKYAFGDKDKYGREVSGGQALGKWAGFNIVAPTPQQTAKERRALILDARQSFYQILKDPTMPPEKKQSAARRFRERIREIQGIE